MKNFWKIICFVMVLPSLLCVSCSDDDEYNRNKTPIINPTPGGDEPKDSTSQNPTVSYYTDPNYYAGFFAFNVMNDVYLWKDEIASSLSNWKMNEDPIKKVDAIRYKQNGTYVDKWTQLTNDYESFIGGVDGVPTTTYGYDFQLYYKDNTRTTLVAVITFVYPDSPASKAGLHRGDAIFTVNGKDITVNNYADLLFYSSTGEFAILNDKGDGLETITMSAVNMYENPVLMTKVFDCDGKKVGYLAYLSFTLDSCEDLIKVAKLFKEQGVTELILDLRYNGGGYVITEQLLASLLGPKEVVMNKEVFETEIWNKDYMDYYKKQGVDLNTYFETEYIFEDHNGKKHTYSTKDANIGLTKIYALLASGSASASEAVLVGLKPYMDIEIIGQQSHGKYCTGWIMSATDWFQDIVDNYAQLSKEQPSKYKSFVETFPEYEKWETYAKNWGIYVMISRYADKNGNNPCMPNGFTPDIEVEDNPQEPYDLGDDREALLRKALTKAGYTNFTPIEDNKGTSRAAIRNIGVPFKSVSRNPLDGKRILLQRPHKTYDLKQPK